MKIQMLISLVLLFYSTAQSRSPQVPALTFPDREWIAVEPGEAGWSTKHIEEARLIFASLPPASLFVVDRGKVVLQWGNPAMKIKVSSMRKSLLSALYGIAVNQGKINLDETLAQLGMDDDPPLSAEEKQATVRMLLQARSGVYHPYVAGTPAMREHMPPRGSHAPGTFWFYNNWDFNALGAIFEKKLHQSIATEFNQKIAEPIHMQDFAPGDMYYVRSRPDSPEYERSRYPAYHFRLTARDIGRFGYLMLHRGSWAGQQIIPQAWVDESTRSYSNANGAGYGYLWWVNDFDLPVKSFSAVGALAKCLVVVPERDLVIVFFNHAEFPDDASRMTPEQLKQLPSVSQAQISHLLQALLAAQRPPDAVP